MAGRTAWYPGHMAKGARQLGELLEKLDLIIEVRDARAPELTASPLAESFGRHKPLWIVLTKRDLAVDSITDEWVSFYKNKGRQVWAFDLLSQQLTAMKSAFAKAKPAYHELRLAVMGIPNVGKSALLNLLVGRKTAAVGGIPGVTRGVSWYRGSGYLAVDSPGILNPRSGAAVERALSWLGCSRPDVIGGWDSVAVSLIEFLQRRQLWSVVSNKWVSPPIMMTMP